MYRSMLEAQVSHKIRFTVQNQIVQRFREFSFIRPKAKQKDFIETWGKIFQLWKAATGAGRFVAVRCGRNGRIGQRKLAKLNGELEHGQ